MNKEYKRKIRNIITNAILIGSILMFVMVNNAGAYGTYKPAGVVNLKNNGHTETSLPIIPSPIIPPIPIPPIIPVNGKINWSGYTWNVVTDGFGSWGNNHYSDSGNNVWIDNKGNLHLKIINVGGIWYCAEINTDKSVGYGTYSINVVSNPANLDDNVIGGLFYYLNDQNELDIEFSRWGVSGTPNTQYTIWGPDGSVESLRFETSAQNTTHKLTYLNNEIMFESLGISSWKYGEYSPETGGHFDINLWLLNGQPPSDGKEQELILSNFSMSPN